MSSPPDAAALIEEFEGARLQRIDAPHPDLFAFTLHHRELHGVLVVSLAPRLAWGWVERRPRGEPASSFVLQLRKHVEGARLLAVRCHTDRAEIELRRAGVEAVLHLTRNPCNVILEVAGLIAGAAKPSELRRCGLSVGERMPPASPGEAALPVDLAELTASGPRLIAATMGAALEQKRRRLLKSVRRQLKKLRRRLQAIAGDLARVEDVATIRHRADLILAHLHSIPARAAEATVTDWNTGSPLTIPIRAGRSAREEAEALYGRAGKLERGGRMAIERQALTENEIAELETIGEAMEEATEAELDELERSAQRLGVATRRTLAVPRASRARVPYRKFFGSGERPILVGRSASDNDALTQSARAWDHWLHARGVRGSHVVVPLAKRETCPPELLIDAAHLAAYHSSVSGEPVVDVQHCARRHVRKPKGFPVGAVLVEREKVIQLRLEADRLALLLRTEER